MAYYFPYWWVRAYPFIVAVGFALVLWWVLCPVGHNRLSDAVGGFAGGLLVLTLATRRRQIAENTQTEA